MKAINYLLYNGNCAEALKFYAESLGGKVTHLSTYGDTPAAAHCPPETHSSVIHGELKVGDQIVMASDCPPDKFDKPQGFFVCLSYDNVSEAEKAFNALAVNANVTMTFGETFFAAGYGQLVDQYGMPWMFICEKPA